MGGNIHLLPILITVTLPTSLWAETLHLDVSRVIQVPRRATWYEAQHYCRKHYTDLVTIRDGENATNLIPLEGWIGLRRRHDGQWRWSKENKLFSSGELCK